jgi:hypothetical protein
LRAELRTPEARPPSLQVASAEKYAPSGVLQMSLAGPDFRKARVGTGISYLLLWQPQKDNRGKLGGPAYTSLTKSLSGVAGVGGKTLQVTANSFIARLPSPSAVPVLAHDRKSYSWQGKIRSERYWGRFNKT